MIYLFKNGTDLSFPLLICFSSCKTFHSATYFNLEDNLKHFRFVMKQMTEKQSNHHYDLHRSHRMQDRYQCPARELCPEFA